MTPRTQQAPAIHYPSGLLIGFKAQPDHLASAFQHARNMPVLGRDPINVLKCLTLNEQLELLSCLLPRSDALLLKQPGQIETWVIIRLRVIIEALRSTAADVTLKGIRDIFGSIEAIRNMGRTLKEPRLQQVWAAWLESLEAKGHGTAQAELEHQFGWLCRRLDGMLEDPALNNLFAPTAPGWNLVDLLTGSTWLAAELPNLGSLACNFAAADLYATLGMVAGRRKLDKYGARDGSPPADILCAFNHASLHPAHRRGLTKSFQPMCQGIIIQIVEETQSSPGSTAADIAGRGG